MLFPKFIDENAENKEHDKDDDCKRVGQPHLFFLNKKKKRKSAPNQVMRRPIQIAKIRWFHTGLMLRISAIKADTIAPTRFFLIKSLNCSALVT